jgi:hypothetical protein
MWPEVGIAQQTLGKIALIEIGGNISNRFGPDTRSQEGVKTRYFIFCKEHLQAFDSTGIIKQIFDLKNYFHVIKRSFSHWTPVDMSLNM